MRKELAVDQDFEYTVKLTGDAEKAFKEAVYRMIETQHVPARMKEIIDQEWQHFAYAKATKQEYNVVGKAITRAVVTGKEKNDETCIYNWIGECLDKFSVQQLFDYLCSVRNLEGHMRNYMEQQIINDEINKINWELGERNKL